jgi:ankyrin repeat protein
MQKKDIAGAVQFVQKLKDVNAIKQKKFTLLHILLSYETVQKHPNGEPAFKEVFDALLERGIDVNARGGNELTALENAAALGIPYYVRRLIEKGANVHAMDKHGFTPLLSVLMYVSPNMPSNYKEVIKLLLDAGADINQQIGIPKKPVNYTLEVDPGFKGSTALFFAIYSRNKFLVKFLLEHGADPSIKNAGGKTALDFAKELGAQEIIPLLSK